MDNPLSKINLKWWHSVLLVVSFTIFVLALTVDMKVSDNETIAYLSSGIFFIALGEFANQGFQQRVGPNFTITKDVRQHTFAGYILIAVGIYLLYKAL